MSVEGHRPADGENMQAFMNALSPGYFKTMKIALLEGRDFTRADYKPNSNVAIVNRKFAEHFFKGASAIGKRIGSGSGPNTKLNVEIVGVVADSLYEGPREGVRRQVFVPHFGAGSAAFYVRTTIPTSAAYSLVRNEVRQQDAALPVYGIKTLEGQLDETLLTDRLVALLSAGFGLLATLLASIGLYGVMAFVVARRKKELGIRLALGAQPGYVIWLVMREVLLLLAIGLAVGIPAAMLLGRYVSSQLYGIEAHDPTIAIATTCCSRSCRPPPGSSRRIAPAGLIRYSRSGTNETNHERVSTRESIEFDGRSNGSTRRNERAETKTKCSTTSLGAVRDCTARQAATSPHDSPADGRRRGPMETPSSDLRHGLVASFDLADPLSKP